MARHPTQSRRRIWIDAICIQQKDEDDAAAQAEKLRQLGIMGRIYSGAETVHVWLGESKHLSAEFPEYLRGLGPGFDVTNVSGQQQHQEEAGGQQGEEYIPYHQEHDILLRIARGQDANRRFFRALGIQPGAGVFSTLNKIRRLNEPVRAVIKVLARDYFQRAWVVQEMALARRLLFWIGDMEIPPDYLLRGVQLIGYVESGGASIADVNLSAPMGPHRGHYALPHLLKARKDIMDGRKAQKGHGWRFEDFLFLCRDREATVVKDKVVLLLGLVDEDLVVTLMGYVQKDKGWDAFHHTYVGCAVELAKRNGWPYVLQLVGRPFTAYQFGDKTDPDSRLRAKLNEPALPSWVPDLRTPLLPKPYDHFGCKYYRAATHIKPAVFRLNQEGHGSDHQWTLTVSAAVVDAIIQVGELYDELNILGGTQTTWEGHMLDLVTKLGY